MEPTDPTVLLAQDFPWLSADPTPLFAKGAKIPEKFKGDRDTTWKELFTAFLAHKYPFNPVTRRDLARLYVLYTSDRTEFRRAADATFHRAADAELDRATKELLEKCIGRYITAAEYLFEEPYEEFKKEFKSLRARVRSDSKLLRAFRPKKGDSGVGPAFAAGNAARRQSLVDVKDLQSLSAKIESDANKFQTLVANYKKVESRLKVMYEAQKKTSSISKLLDPLQDEHKELATKVQNLCQPYLQSPADARLPPDFVDALRPPIERYYSVLNYLMRAIQDKIGPEIADIWRVRTAQLLKSGYGKHDEYEQDFEMLEVMNLMQLPVKALLSIAVPIPLVGPALGTVQKVVTEGAAAMLNAAEAQRHSADEAVQLKYAEFRTNAERRVEELAKKLGDRPKVQMPDGLELAEQAHGVFERAEVLAHYVVSTLAAVAHTSSEASKEALESALHQIEPGLLAAGVGGSLSERALAAMERYRDAIALYGPEARYPAERVEGLRETLQVSIDALAGRIRLERPPTVTAIRSPQLGIGRDVYGRTPGIDGRPPDDRPLDPSYRPPQPWSREEFDARTKDTKTSVGKRILNDLKSAARGHK